jgi:hypothetical protein
MCSNKISLVITDALCGIALVALTLQVVTIRSPAKPFQPNGAFVELLHPDHGTEVV